MGRIINNTDHTFTSNEQNVIRNAMANVGIDEVTNPAPFGYRFKITSNQNNSILGTGFMTASKTLDKTEQMDLFHSWTHGKYLKSENYVSVSVSQVE